jgi:hypothetical protein
MRGALKYGVPIAAGLATGGYALSQGEDPGSAGLAAGLGATGAAGGLLASRKLAGKYAPSLYKAGLSGKQAMDAELLNKAVQMEARQKAEGLPRSFEQKAVEAMLSGSANINLPQQAQVEQGLKKTLGAALVPASAAAAGLGGVALGAVPGAMGMPGFQQGIDPESYTSSNMPGARQSISTLQY